jgi:hypothetical protein
LAELHTSHLGFFHDSARRASSRAALSATYLADETPFGKRWIFQDVHSGGAASIAGIEPGDILLTVDGREIVPPEHPVFPMGTETNRELLSIADSTGLSCPLQPLIPWLHSLGMGKGSGKTHSL